MHGTTPDLITRWLHYRYDRKTGDDVIYIDRITEVTVNRFDCAAVHIDTTLPTTANADVARASLRCPTLRRQRLVERASVVALTFFRRYKRPDWRFCACAIYVKSSVCSEKTIHLWYKYYGLFKVICRKLTRGKQVLKHILIVSENHVTVVRHNPW